MQVRELIEQLSRMNPDADVYFSHNSGDYWRTQVASDIDNIEEGRVEHSDYHNKMKVVDEDDYINKQAEIREQVEEEGGQYVEPESNFVVLIS